MLHSLDREMLEKFLLSDAVPQDSMGIYDLDGFLAGLAAGPEAVLYEEWSSSLWGSGMPCYRDRAQEELIISIILRRYDQITAALADASIAAAAFYLEDSNDPITMASAWASGFLQAMELRPDAWLPLTLRSPESIYLMPLLTLYRETAEEYDLPFSEELKQAIVSAAAEQIPACVRGIYRFWNERPDIEAPRPNSANAAGLREEPSAVALVFPSIGQTSSKINVDEGGGGIVAVRDFASNRGRNTCH